MPLCYSQQKQMLGPVSKSENPYLANLKQLARIAQYEPVASIQKPSQDFNYTIVRNRYSDYYQIPKVVRRPAKNSNNQKDKLATILETHGRSPLFPKIAKKAPDTSEDHLLQSSHKKVRKLRSYFKQENNTTNTSRERSLTIDTRLQSEEGRKSPEEAYLKQDLTDVKPEKPYSLGSRTAERQKLYSNGSELSLMIGRKHCDQSRIQSQVYQSREKTINQSSPGIFFEEEQEESDSDGQFQKEAVPGPGTYSYSYSDFDKTKNTQSTSVSFLSKNTRFRYKKKEKSPVKVINPIQEEKQEARQKRLKENRPKKKEFPFGLGSPRKFECDERSKEKVPGPEYYYPRQGMQESLIRNIQLHFKGKFGTNCPRFKYQNPQNPNIAPGCYQPSQFSDELQNQNFYFKSNKERFS